MAILNPQYAFLEADYNNNNLYQVIPKVDNSSEKLRGNNDAITPLKVTSATLFLNVKWRIGLLMALPADIYCIAYLLIVEIFS